LRRSNDPARALAIGRARSDRCGVRFGPSSAGCARKTHASRDLAALAPRGFSAPDRHFAADRLGHDRRAHGGLYRRVHLEHAEHRYRAGARTRSGTRSPSRSRDRSSATRCTSGRWGRIDSPTVEGAAAAPIAENDLSALYAPRHRAGAVHWTLTVMTTDPQAIEAVALELQPRPGERYTRACT